MARRVRLNDSPLVPAVDPFGYMPPSARTGGVLPGTNTVPRMPARRPTFVGGPSPVPGVAPVGRPVTPVARPAGTRPALPFETATPVPVPVQPRR